MGVIHTPRTLYAVAKGFWNRSRKNHARPVAAAATATTTTPTTTTTAPSSSSSSSILVPAGIGRDNPHIYTARMGLFDVDYLGHMNNASYLSHAEYARWQMCAENGLIAAMWRHNLHFVVLGSSIRYRKEIRPFFRSFCIETSIVAIDNDDDRTTNTAASRNMWIVHNFRLPSSSSSNNNKPNQERIVAQVLVQGAAIQGRTRVDPAELLVRHVGIDPAVVETLRLRSVTSPSGLSLTSAADKEVSSSSTSDDYDDDEWMIRKYVALQQSFQEIASKDDKKHM